MSEKLAGQIDILIVDDDVTDLKTAEEILEKDFSIITARSGKEAFSLLEEYMPKLILLNLHMPNMDGRETMEKLQENAIWKSIPVIFQTADYDPGVEKECFALGAADFIVKPFIPMVMQSRISRTIELYGLRNDLEARLEIKTRQVENVSLNSIMAIANTIDAKDTYTSGHSVRVAKCAKAIAERLGWSEEEIENIHYMALLHDIGKIGVPDSILNKPSRLSEEEFALIKRHPVVGAEILKDIHMIKDVSDGALCHHERFDGKGYPSGLKGKEIPLCARIIGIADTYDAMTSNRIYRAKLSDKKVIEEFERCSGTQFDPELAELFVSMLKEGFHIPKEQRRWEDGISLDHFDRAGESTILLNKVLNEYTASAQNKGMTDSLTGLPNRNYGETQIEIILNSAGQGAFLMIDLDNFKSINDTYGHIVGDRVLKIMADSMAEAAEEGDIICRLGGDEFVMFLTDILDRERIKAKSEEIMDLFAQNMKKMSLEKTITLSIGIAVSSTDGRRFSVLYNNADKALYHVKRNGKNAYAFFSEEKDEERGVTLGTDLNHIRYLLEGRMDKSKGAFHVEYEEFKKLYDYLSRCVERKGQMVQTLLFTIGSEGRGYLDNAISEEAMAALEVAVTYSLRRVDVGSRYSSMQFIVILVDTNLENGKMVAGRVINQFYKIYSGTGVTLSYDIQSMVTGHPEEDESQEKLANHEND